MVEPGVQRCARERELVQEIFITQLPQSAHVFDASSGCARIRPDMWRKINKEGELYYARCIRGLPQTIHVTTTWMDVPRNE